MSNNICGDTLTATMCKMVDMQEIEVIDEYTKGFSGSEIKIATKVSNWLANNWEWIVGIVTVIIVVCLVIVFFPEDLLAVMGVILYSVAEYMFGSAFVIWVAVSSSVWLMNLQNIFSKFGGSVSNVITAAKGELQSLGNALYTEACNISSWWNTIALPKVDDAIRKTFDFLYNQAMGGNITKFKDNMRIISEKMEKFAADYESVWQYISKGTGKGIFYSFWLLDSVAGLVMSTPELKEDMNNGQLLEMISDAVLACIWPSPNFVHKDDKIEDKIDEWIFA